MGHIQLDNEDYRRIDDRLHRCILLQSYYKKVKCGKI